MKSVIINLPEELQKLTPQEFKEAFDRIENDCQHIHDGWGATAQDRKILATIKQAFTQDESGWQELPDVMGKLYGALNLLATAKIKQALKDGE